MTASPGPNASQNAVKVLAYTEEPSTRYLIDIAIDTDKYALTYADSELEIRNVATRDVHDIYLIDISTRQGEERTRLLKDLAALKLKKKLPLLLLVDEIPPDNANHSEPVGPMCFVECYFTASRLNQMLEQVQSMNNNGVQGAKNPRYHDLTA